MTKHRNTKSAIRAYMRTHNVNYTTAQRALAAARTSPHPNDHPDQSHPHLPRLAALKAAIATGDTEQVNTALRANTPGPDPWDLAYTLAALADDQITLDEHTSDPETPVTDDLLRLAVRAAASHGHHRTGGRWWPTADQVCRSALIALPVTPDPDPGPGTPSADGQHPDAPVDPVDPADLAAIITELADDQMALDETAHGTGLTGEDLAEALLLLAADLDKPTTPRTNSTTLPHAHHVLRVTTDPLTAADRADMSTEDLADYRFAPDRTYAIECPGIKTGRCEGWEECTTCWLLTDTQTEKLEKTGEAHGVEHQHMSFGWATATGQCSLHAYPDAWIDAATDLDLPPGRYAIDFDWDDGCDLILLDH